MYGIRDLRYFGAQGSHQRYFFGSRQVKDQILDLGLGSIDHFRNEMGTGTSLVAQRHLGSFVGTGDRKSSVYRGMSGF